LRFDRREEKNINKGKNGLLSSPIISASADTILKIIG
jgi:hypothetical protein